MSCYFLRLKCVLAALFHFHIVCYFLSSISLVSKTSRFCSEQGDGLRLLEFGLEQGDFF